ncbi:hypothetical protein [Micromonospora sp. U21]|uniref:hypothetical protein n=1 Tax=Micromonospora sp. U21 TaxID=2824899 RepID=UPI001B385245|nr:hypothetical protein [Micromonospora sp. U21]MBQ0906846.1 hypothetical protein [Micromonospora sp. U21]
MPEHWTVTRIASQLHRMVLAPLGFERQGNRCARSDSGLVRRIVFYGSAATTPRVQIQARIGIAGLPEPMVEHRCDELWGAPRPLTGPSHYPRPRSGDDLPANLVADVAGPAVEFLLRAEGLGELALWAQEIFLGDTHPGWWGRFQPVLPQGTGPLQAAAFAAAMMGDPELTEFLALRVANEEPDEHRLADFRTELRHVTTHTINKRY